MEQKELFKEAIELFDAGEYDKSVQNLIGLYELGYEKEQILDFLYQAFVEPNIEEFKKNYQTQADGLIEVEYEDTQLDFIPVSDEKFYIWYKEEQRFVGNIDLNFEAQIDNRQHVFQSLLIAQTCDIREMIPFLLNKQYNTIYIVLNKNKEIFASFLKLPKIRKYFLENVIIFENEKIMQLFFEEYSEFYIPRSIIAKDSQKYVTFFDDLHKKRLLKKREKNNVFFDNWYSQL